MWDLLHNSCIVSYVTMHKALEHINFKKITNLSKGLAVLVNSHKFITHVKMSLYGMLVMMRHFTVSFSSLSAKLEHLTELQRHLEQSLHSTPDHSPHRGGEGGGTTPAGSTNTSYNTYYLTGRGKGGPQDTHSQWTARKKFSMVQLL